MANESSNYYARKAIKEFFRKYGLATVAQSNNGVEYTNRFLSELNPKRVKEAALSGFEEIEKVVTDYEIYYNTRRPHDSLNGLTPYERFNNLESQIAA